MSIMQMSITAGLLVIAITLIRITGLNRLPKAVFPLFWGLALFRLLIPVSIPVQSRIFATAQELVAAALPSEVALQMAVPSQNATTGMLHASGMQDQISQTVQEQGFLLAPMTIVWLLGLFAMLAFLVVVCLQNHRKLRFAIRIRGNDFLDEWQSTHKLWRPISILQSDQIQTPIAVGLLRPRIILPKSMDMSNQQLLSHVLIHEYFHIKRWDALWKLLFALALCIHWFNPFVWLMFVLANRDLELSCDERVIRHFGAETKQNYACSLIRMAEQRSKFAPLYSGFSKHVAAERIESIMKFKKVSLIGTAIAFLAVFVLAVGALASPYANTPEEALPYETTPAVSAAAASAEPAARELSQISGVTEAVQGHELTIQLIETHVMECGQYELVSLTEERQRVLVDENTAFEVAIVVNAEFERAEAGSFADIHPQGRNQSLTVYGQEQDGVFLAERIIIWTFEW